MNLSVNIDHIATLRQARRGLEPDPVAGALEALRAGADGITFHLREDRRHIQDADVFRLKEAIQAPLNFEAAFAPDIVELILKIQPREVTLVPEKRQEVTTEGGLDVLFSRTKLLELIPRFKDCGIRVSLFVDPDPVQIEASAQVKADAVELHTGHYAHAKGGELKQELDRLNRMTELGLSFGLMVNAGHGLNYENTAAVAQIQGIHELNIGHSIISRAVFSGLFEAVKVMKELMKKG